MPCTRARSSHTRQRTSSYDEPSAARRPRRGRAHSSAPRGRRAPSLQSTLFIAAPQGHSGRNHSVWGTRAATRHRKRHPPSCVVDPPRASFRPAPLPTDLRPRILYRPPPRAGSYNLRSGSCTYLTPIGKNAWLRPLVAKARWCGFMHCDHDAPEPVVILGSVQHSLFPCRACAVKVPDCAHAAHE
jgi:hypothetical protein